MKLFITAKPRAREESVRKISATAGEMHFLVSVKEPPVQGRANAAILKTLADYLDIAPSCLRIISGHTRRQKIVEVL